MSSVTKPMALDESFNTTESTPRNTADVLAEELSSIASAITSTRQSAVRSVSDTTDNSGYFMVAFSSNVIVLTAWAQQGDCIVSFFPSQGADEHGRINWWFRIMNESMQPRTSAPITLYIMYTTY